MVRALLLPLAAALPACSPGSIADDQGHSTTSPGTMSSSTDDESGATSAEDTTTSSESGADLPDDEPVACDVWLQDCPLDQKCVPYASRGGTWDAHKCVPILGDGQVDETCISDGKADATDDCGAGLMCWGASEVDGELVGQCAALCQNSLDDPYCEPSNLCVVGPGSDVPAVCAMSCDPFLQDCPEGLACGWTSSMFVCVGSQGVALGEPCEFFDDCQAGAVCLPSEAVPGCAGSSCCAGLCDPWDEPSCPEPDTECVEFFNDPWNRSPVGACAEPDWQP